MPSATGGCPAGRPNRTFLGMRPLCLVALGALAAAPCLAAQDTTGSRTLVPVPAVFYQPETGLAFGAAVGLFVTPPPRTNGTPLPTSSALAVAIFTTKAQLLTSLTIELWPRDARRHVIVALDFQRFPTTYWGLGNDTPDAAEEDYTPVFAAGALEWTGRTRGALYLGGAIRLRWRNLAKTVAGGLLENPVTPGTGTGLIAGAGPLVSWDTRDKVSGPHRGALLQFRADAYADTPGPGGAFGLTMLDLRGYVSLAPGQTLALQAVGRSVWGDAPFDQLAELGGDALLRGYFQGRFRDRTLVAVQAEYRGTVIGPLGFAAAAALGQVAPALRDLTGTGFHAAVGGGLRVLIDRAAGLAIRVDWATATDGSSSGLYFSAGEAF